MQFDTTWRSSVRRSGSPSVREASTDPRRAREMARGAMTPRLPGPVTATTPGASMRQGKAGTAPRGGAPRPPPPPRRRRCPASSRRASRPGMAMTVAGATTRAVTGKVARIFGHAVVRRLGCRYIGVEGLDVWHEVRRRRDRLGPADPLRLEEPPMEVERPFDGGSRFAPAGLAPPRGAARHHDDRHLPHAARAAARRATTRSKRTSPERQDRGPLVPTPRRDVEVEFDPDRAQARLRRPAEGHAVPPGTAVATVSGARSGAF